VTGRDLAVARGWADTRATLHAWKRAPLVILGRWVPLSLAVTAVLLCAVWVVGSVSRPESWTLILPGVQRPATAVDALEIFGRNLLVLALHSLACLAGFIAKSSLPLEAEDHTGWWRWAHDHAGSAAMVFVGGATLFSLGTQAYALGGVLATLAPQFGTTPGVMLATMAPHAILELTALFLPLAAWMVAARSGAWHQLMAATFATTALALPVLVAAAVIEITVTPWLIRALHFV
jgi:hypothetical protein